MRDTAGLAAVRASVAPVARFFTASPWRARIGQPGVADFAFGSPRRPLRNGLPGSLSADSLSV